MAIADRPTELSEQVIEAVKKGQQSALDAVRSFVETIDHALPLHGEGPSRRQEVIDSALAMADRLVQSQYDFLSTMIRSAGNSLGASVGEKPAQPASKTARKVAAAPARRAAAAKRATPASGPTKRARRPVTRKTDDAKPADEAKPSS
jgi:hypothetical protein